MSRQKSITLQSFEVKEFFELDEERIERFRTSWKNVDPTPHLLSERPEKPYPGAVESRLVKDSIFAGGENGYNPNRSHYKALERALLDPDEQLSRGEAFNVWEIETRDGKYGQATWPKEDLLTARADKVEIDPESIRVTFTKLYDDFQTIHGSWGGVTGCLRSLSGLMAILIGPLETWKIWSDVVPVATRPDISPLLPVVDGQEEELRALCKQELEGVTFDQLSKAHLGMIARVGDERLARLVCEKRPELLESNSSSQIVCKLANRRDLFIDLFSNAFARSFDADRFEEFVAIAQGPELASVCKGITKLKKVTDKKAAMGMLSKVHTKHLVAGMLDIYNDKKIGKLAEHWLLHEGANAIAGLIPEVSGRSKRGKLAASLLQRYRDMGHEELISEITNECDEASQKMVHKYVLDHYTAEREVIEQEERPAWLEELMSDRAMARKNLPKFLELEGLPQVLTRSRKVLSLEELEWLVRCLKESTLTSAHPAIAQFHAWLDPASAANLATTLVDGWTRAGSHKNYVWMLEAPAHFHDKYTPAFVEKQISRWRKKDWSTRQEFTDHTMGVIGELYSRAGYATALTILLDRSHDNHKEGYHKVIQVIDRIVEEKGLTTRSELEDLAVPDFEFNERGERDFDYGARHFTLRLGDDLTPVFYDPESGDVSARMPSKRKSDDDEKVALAKAAYKKDKKLLKDTVERQRERLEHAMEQKLYWEFEHWKTNLLDHPLMKNFARRLLWRVQRTGKSDVIVRVTEDFQLSDVDDEDISLEGLTRIRIVRPGDLKKDRVEAWSRLMADYEIVQPFPQF